MKILFLVPVATLCFFACNNTETSGSKSDTASTTIVSDSAVHDHMNSDTAGMAGKSMMSSMTNMMNAMKGMQSSGNPDNDFAAMMKAHHLGAIEMAQLQLAQGSDERLRTLAQKMVDDQQKEVAELNTFLSGHQAHGGGDGFFKEAIEIMNGMMMDMDHSGSVDRQFASMMIPHHQTAIDMAKAYLKSGAHEEKLKTMANSIITTQQNEIAELKNWLATNK